MRESQRVVSVWQTGRLAAPREVTDPSLSLVVFGKDGCNSRLNFDSSES